MNGEEIRVCISGYSGCGKSTLGVKLLQSKYNKKFHRVILFCPTFNSPRNKEIYPTLGLRSQNIFKNYEPDKVEELWNIKKIKAPKEAWLIIFDDCMSEPYFKETKPSAIINRLVCRGRHDGISVMFIVQDCFGISPTCRKNCSEIYLYPTSHQGELEHYYSIGGDGTKKDFFNMIKSYKDRGTWLYMNTDTRKLVAINFSGNKNKEEAKEISDDDNISSDSYDSYDSHREKYNTDGEEDNYDSDY